MDTILHMLSRGVDELIGRLSGPLHFIGDQGRDPNFQALMRVTRIGDGAVTASFDGRYTNVAPAAARDRLAWADARRLP